MRTTIPKHIIRSQDFTPDMIFDLIKLAEVLRVNETTNEGRKFLGTLLSGRRLFADFYEPSTRTRFSFETAALFLGMTKVTTESAGIFSSASKGETLEDSIHALCMYHPDVIVLRHIEDGAAERAALASVNGVHVVNAGDGTGQHPTQALLDVYTIWRELGRLENFTILMGGDLLHGRTVHSLAYLLSRYRDVKMIFMSHPGYQMKQDILDHLDERGIEYEIVTNGEIPIERADVVYWTRDQTERHGSSVHDNHPKLIITPSLMRSAKETMVLMHPLPRVYEIDPRVDSDPRAAYFRQVENGLFMRMAILFSLLGDMDRIPHLRE